ncbi:MAG: hypothetical protein ACTSVL_10290 [Promethearchaeota archaeon]
MEKKNPQELLHLAHEMIEEGKILESLEYLNSLEPIDEITNREKTIFYNLKSEIHWILFDNQESYEAAEKGIHYAKKIGNGIEVVDAHLRMGKVFLSMGKFKESMDLLEKSSEILNNLTKISEKDRNRRIGRINMITGAIFYNLGETMKSIEQFDKSIELLKKWDSKAYLALAYSFYGNLFMLIGESDKALDILSKSQEICEYNESPAYNHPKLLYFFGMSFVYSVKGEFQLALDYTKKGVSLARKCNSTSYLFMALSNLGGIYQIIGEWELAIKNLKDALLIIENSGRNSRIIALLDNFFDVYINMGDIIKAKQVFHRIENLYAEIEENKRDNLIYRYCKAVLLKMSKRTRELGVAQEIFFNIAQEEVIQLEFTQGAILNLCEMLLDEFKETKNVDVLEDFSSLLKRLQNAAEKQHAYPILAETYLLDAKLSMITFELIKTRQSLTKAQQIAERYGLNLLAVKISNEHDKLLQNLEVWEQMKKDNVSISERLEKLDINDQISTMLKKKQAKKPEQLPESPILLLIMADSGIPLYTQIFNKEWKFEEELFSGFLSAFNSFSDEIFSEGLDRASFGKYTILMTAMPPFMSCYVFIGQSFLAQQKFSKFNENIHESEQLWKILISANRTGKVIKNESNSMLDKLMKSIF